MDNLIYFYFGASQTKPHPNFFSPSSSLLLSFHLNLWLVHENSQNGKEMCVGFLSDTAVYSDVNHWYSKLTCIFCSLLLLIRNRHSQVTVILYLNDHSFVILSKGSALILYYCYVCNNNDILSYKNELHFFIPFAIL